MKNFSEWNDIKIKTDSSKSHIFMTANYLKLKELIVI